ncbi:ABC transporter permease [Rhodococcus sp. NPDC057529]|uniref:ABC transporter permease n=1 Tax=Rhodococcus sp. NPDC057529 TaxID=3346158 RepID=UPI00367270A2
MKTRLTQILSQTSGRVGCILLAFVGVVAVGGPFMAPYSPTEPITAPGMGPGPSVLGTGYLLLGSDYLGRDVLSRVLSGGLSVIAIGLTATLIAYLVGVTLGLLAGYVEKYVGAAVMRCVDVILAFPPLLVLLLLVGGLQSHIWVLILGVVIVQIPNIVRITRASTAAVARSAYVEVAKARGERTPTIWKRDILPNILPTVLADFGIRFGLSIILVASMNFLGLGLAPPASDWGLMTSENQSLVTLNPLAIVAPGIMLALLSIGVNLVADAYVKAVAGRGTTRRMKKTKNDRLGITQPVIDPTDSEGVTLR